MGKPLHRWLKDRYADEPTRARVEARIIDLVQDGGGPRDA